MMETGRTTIDISKETHKDAKAEKRDGETWDDFVRRCVDESPNPSGHTAEVELTFDDDEIEALSERLEAAVGGSGVSYDDVKAACQAALRDELPEGVLRS